MSPDEWNKSDRFVLRLFSSINPMDRGFEGVEQVLEVIESLDAELRPDQLRILGPRLKYSRQALRKRLHEAYFRGTLSFLLVRSRPPAVTVSFTSRTEETGVLCYIELSIDPCAFVRQPGQAEGHANNLVSFVRSLSSRLPLSHGMGHSFTDLCLGTDPRLEDRSMPRPIYEVFWLNVYGPDMVQALGHERVLSTPSALMEELPGGAVLFLTRPTPADFDSEEARIAQARALVHLRPEISLKTTLDTLRQRSLEFVPIPMEFDPDVADILRLEVDFQGVLGGKRKLVERFNQYRPPAVSEWLPAAQASAPDVDDVKAAIDTYEGLYAEQLIALFHNEMPQVMDGTLEALHRLDWHLWHSSWGRKISAEQRETLVPALGAFLGRYLVEALSGRWLPRKNLDEAGVVVGNRVWLPFLRARHALQGQEAPLDFSCSQFFRTAQRFTQAHTL